MDKEKKTLNLIAISHIACYIVTLHKWNNVYKCYFCTYHMSIHHRNLLEQINLLCVAMGFSYASANLEI